MDDSEDEVEDNEEAHISWYWVEGGTMFTAKDVLEAAMAEASAALTTDPLSLHAQGGMQQAVRFVSSAKATLAGEGLLLGNTPQTREEGLARLAALAEDALVVCLNAIRETPSGESLEAAEGGLLFATHFAERMRSHVSPAHAPHHHNVDWIPQREHSHSHQPRSDRGSGSERRERRRERNVGSRSQRTMAGGGGRGGGGGGKNEGMEGMIDQLASALMRSVAVETSRGVELSDETWDAVKTANKLRAEAGGGMGSSGGGRKGKGRVSLPDVEDVYADEYDDEYDEYDEYDDNGYYEDPYRSPRRSERRTSSSRRVVPKRVHSRYRARAHPQPQPERRTSRSQPERRASRSPRKRVTPAPSRSRARDEGLRRVRVQVGDRAYLIVDNDMESWTVRDLCEATTLRANRNPLAPPTIVRELAYLDAICGEDDLVVDLVDPDDIDSGKPVSFVATCINSSFNPSPTQPQPQPQPQPQSPIQYHHHQSPSPLPMPQTPQQQQWQPEWTPPPSAVRAPEQQQPLHFAPPPPAPAPSANPPGLDYAQFPGLDMRQFEGLDEGLIKERLTAALSDVSTETLVQLAQSLQ